MRVKSGSYFLIAVMVIMVIVVSCPKYGVSKDKDASYYFGQYCSYSGSHRAKKGSFAGNEPETLSEEKELHRGDTRTGIGLLPPDGGSC
jgi:hypothetical protein